MNLYHTNPKYDKRLQQFDKVQKELDKLREMILSDLIKEKELEKWFVINVIGNYSEDKLVV